MNEVDVLCHHGIKGQKWGVRRYQNPDGTLTPAGEQRYSVARAKQYRKAANYAGALRSRALRDQEKVTEQLLKRKMRGLPPTKNQMYRALANAKIADNYFKAEKQAKDLISQVNEKYGEGTVKDLKYKTEKTGKYTRENVVSGNVITGGHVAAAAGATAASIAFATAIAANPVLGLVPASLITAGIIGGAKGLYYQNAKQSYADAFGEDEVKLVDHIDLPKINF